MARTFKFPKPLRAGDMVETNHPACAGRGPFVVVRAGHSHVIVKDRKGVRSTRLPASDFHVFLRMNPRAARKKGASSD